MSLAPAHPGPWIDHHCHLGLSARGDDAIEPSALVAEARDAGVVALVTVGTDVATSREAIRLAGARPDVFATAGVHPHEAVRGTDGLHELFDAVDTPKMPVAVGECGLDHHYDHSPRDAQRRVFADQVALANQLDLPLVVHTRDAWDDTFSILDDGPTPRRTVVHCFTGGPAEAERCLERGAIISFSGIVTFPSADELRDAVRVTPLGSLLVETDSPYLAPVPHRGRPNRPAHVGLVGAAVAELRGIDVDEVADATTRTARRFYGLPAVGPDAGGPWS